MKSYLACLGKILLLLLGYYIVQLLVMTGFAMIGGLDASGDIQAAMQSFLESRTALVSLVADAAAIALLALGYSFSKRGFASDMRLTPVPAASLWPVALGGAAAAVAVGCLMRVLPAQVSGVYGGVAQQAASDENIILRVLATAVAAPMAQELIFRGCIYGALSRCSRRSAAVILSSVLYGMMHSSPAWMVIAFLLGLAFAFSANAYGSLLPAMLFHAVFCLAGMLAFDGCLLLETWAAGILGLFAAAALSFCLFKIKKLSRMSAANGGNDASGN